MGGLGVRGRRFDLHLHSTRSDGALSPHDLLAQCAEGGLDVVALTDHDLSSGLPCGEHDVGGRTVRVVEGAEVSGVHDGREYHLLVYFPGEAPASFRAFCAQRCAERAERYATSVGNLDLDGLPAVDDLAARGHEAITRQHLAMALVDAGHAKDVRDAFKRFAADQHGHVPRVSLPFVEAIRIAREAGGVTSWAHPSVRAIESYLPAFVEAGLQGLEGIRPGLDRSKRKRIARAAKKHGLFLTGGSDWHGWTGGRPGLFHVERAELDGFLAALAAA